jgi:hypothetical protein
MNSLASQMVLLCEDKAQERLALAYMKKCGFDARRIRSVVASELVPGGNVGWVLDEFPKQLQACRQRNKKAKTLLVVIVDADQFSVEERRRHLCDRLKRDGSEALTRDEPAALLIPKRNIETWVHALLGTHVSEEMDYKTRDPFPKNQIAQAALALFEWSRPNATPGETCTFSLRLALPEWRKIG